MMFRFLCLAASLTLASCENTVPTGAAAPEVPEVMAQHQGHAGYHHSEVPIEELLRSTKKLIDSVVELPKEKLELLEAYEPIHLERYLFQFAMWLHYAYPGAPERASEHATTIVEQLLTTAGDAAAAAKHTAERAAEL